MVITGAKERISLGYEETSYGTKSASITKVFGYGQKLGATLTNTVNELIGTEQRGASHIGVSHIVGSGSAEFVLSDSHFMRFVFGKHEETGTTLKTHTYTIDDASSFTISDSYDTATASTRFLLGCLVDSFRLTIEKDEPFIQCSIDFKYANESADTSYASSVSPLVVPFRSTQSTLNIGGAIDFERVELSITTNAKVWIPANSRTGTDGVGTDFKAELSVTIPYEAITYVNNILTTVTDTTAFTLTITNGETDDDLRNFIFSGTLAYEELEKGAISAEEIIKNGLKFKIKGLQLVAKDGTAW